MAQAHVRNPFSNLNLKVLDRDHIDPKRMALFLGITKEELAKILKKTVRAIDKDPSAKDTQAKLHKLMYLTHLMKKHIEQSHIKIWLRAPNEDFGRKSPLSLLEENRVDEDSMNILIQYIEDYSKGTPA